MNTINRKFRTPEIYVSILVVLTFVVGLNGPSLKPLFESSTLIVAIIQSLTVALLALNIRNVRVPYPGGKVLLGLLLVFSVLAVISTVLAGDFLGSSAKRLIVILGLGVPAAIGALAVEQPRKLIHGVLAGFVAIGIFLTAYSTLLYAVGTITSSSIVSVDIFGVTLQQTGYGRGINARLASLTGNPNTLSGSLMFAMISASYFILARRISIPVGALIIAFLSIGQFFTLSRTGIGGSVLGIGLLLLFFWLEKKPKPRHLLAFFAVLAVLAVAILPALSSTRLSNTDLSGRGKIWEALSISILEHPLTGRGFGVSREAIVEPAVELHHGHNIYLTIASEVGIPGLFIFVTIWVMAIILAFRKYRAGQIEMLFVAAYFSVMAIHQIMESTILRSRPQTFFFLLLLGFVAAPMVNRLPDTTEPEHHPALPRT